MSTSSEEVPDRDEIISSIAELISGASLLKAAKGDNHFRSFQLTQDLTRLIWYSPRKEKPGVLISEITEIVYGQKTQVFKNRPVPGYEALSFSLLYSNRTLDIVCKDKREYKVWTVALKALLDGFSDADAVSMYMAHKGRRGKFEDKVAVHIGTLTAKISVREDACDLYTWGRGDYGVLGHRENDTKTLPCVVESLLGRNIVEYAIGTKHMVAVSDKGDVYSWGSGQYGRLGQGHLRDRYSPLMISAPLRGKQVQQVACNEFHSAAVCDTGELFTWGRAGPHLGYQTDDRKQMQPRLVNLGDRKAEYAACGNGHTIVFVSDKSVYAFGNNEFGQLGTGDSETTYEPKLVKVPDSIGPTVLICGKYHSALLSIDCCVLAWGRNDKGQLGLGDQSDRLIPTQVEFTGEHLVAGISCGESHTAAFTTNSILFCWGDNDSQQLGLNKQQKMATSPVAVILPSGHQIQQVSCGAKFTAILTSSSTLFTWGNNSNGQLGHGDVKQRNVPTELEALRDKQLRSIQCGGDLMACAVLHSWVPDEEAKGCMACKNTFTTFRRRHHCRECGGVFCGNCTTKRFPLLHMGKSDPVRVCDRCYISLTSSKA